MLKRSPTSAPEWFSSTSGSVLINSEDVVEVEPVSRSVSHVEAKAAKASSPTPVFTFGAGSDVEEVDSRSRLTICRGACPPTLRAALH